MRRRLVIVALGVVLLAVVPLTAVFALTLSRSLERDSASLLRARLEAVGSTLELDHGRVRTRETGGDAVLDSSTWIFDTGPRLVEQPARRSPVDEAARALAGQAARSGRAVRQDAGDLSLLAAPLALGGGRSVTVVAGLSKRPYEDAERTALTAAILLDAAILGVVGLLTWQTVTAALNPVARMTQAAADWGAHDVARRFDLGPPRDELTALAATLDELLDRLQASLGHERRLTAEIAHELRTPISRIRTQAEVALRSRTSTTGLRQVLREVVDDTAVLAQTIDTLLQTAATRDATSPPGAPLDQVVGRALAEAGLEPASVDLDLDPGSRSHRSVLAADPYTAVRALVPVLGNARAYGGGRVRVSVRRQPGQVTVAVQDDGPGFAGDEPELAFQPGMRGSAGRGTPGAGLGLPLARRLARTCGGDVTIDAGSCRGAVVLVTFPTLPSAAVTSPDQAGAPSPAITSGPLSSR